jgi:hypothetical protein
LNVSSETSSGMIFGIVSRNMGPIGAGGGWGSKEAERLTEQVGQQFRAQGRTGFLEVNSTDM